MFVMVSSRDGSPAVRAALAAAIQQEIAEISEIGVNSDCIVVIWQRPDEPDESDQKVVISVQGLTSEGIQSRVGECLRAIACKYLGKCEVLVRPLPSMHHMTSVLSDLVAA